MLEQIDYQFLDDEDLQNTSLSNAANSSRFLKSLPLDLPEVPLRPLFAELHDVRWLMAEMAADSVLVTISLDLPEIGVRGEAVVTGLEPCPAILPGPGKVVLTTFHHASSDLIDLYLSPQPPPGVNSASSTHLTSTSSSLTGPLTTLQTSEEALLYPRASRATSIDPSWERIGVTGNHPIWSQDRHDYVAAMDLRLGERLKNLSGDTVWVQQKLPRPGPTPVYNLEVQDEHVYYVGTDGVLAHNTGKPNELECQSTGQKNPEVEAIFEQNRGRLFYDRNGPTAGLSGSDFGLMSGGNLHAETGAMAQAFAAGQSGGVGRLLVDTTNYSKDRICQFCLTDIKRMGTMLNLDELHVTHITRKGNVEYFFNKTGLLPTKNGGSSWQSARVRRRG